MFGERVATGRKVGSGPMGWDEEYEKCKHHPAVTHLIEWQRESQIRRLSSTTRSELSPLNIPIPNARTILSYAAISARGPHDDLLLEPLKSIEDIVNLDYLLKQDNSDSEDRKRTRATRL